MRQRKRGTLLVLTVAIASVLLVNLLTIPFAGRAQGASISNRNGALWVFAVGVSQYKNGLISLQFADHDAQALADALAQRAAALFSRVNTKVLVNDQVTRRSIIASLLSFFSQARPADTGVIALMGHGVQASGTFYYVPYPADTTNLDSQGLPVAEFAEAVHQVSPKLRRTVLVVDTCHADELYFRVRDLTPVAAREPLARGISLVNAIQPTMPDAYILSSSTGSESSWEDGAYRLPGETKGHGAFTYALLRGLDGEAARNGAVNIFDLFSYASEEVAKVTGDKQHPVASTHGTNFEIAEARDISPAQQQQATSLTQQGVKALQHGDLKQAQVAFAGAGTANPRDEVAGVLHDEVTKDIAYKNDPQAQQDVIEQTAELLKKNKNRGPVDPWTPRPLALALLDFRTLGNPPELAGLHEALVARISQSLQGTKRVSVVDRHLLDQVMRELRLSMSDLSDPDTRLKLGRILVARLLGTGNVVFTGQNKYLVNLQMIDNETTEIKVNVSEAGAGADQILQVADKIQSDIITKLQQGYPLRGKIAALSGDLAILDIGSKAGATVGTRMNAVTEEPITVNGEVVARRLKVLGSMEITEVHDKVSFAQMVDHKAPPRVGTKVIESSKSAPAANSSAATTLKPRGVAQQLADDSTIEGRALNRRVQVVNLGYGA